MKDIEQFQLHVAAMIHTDTLFNICYKNVMLKWKKI